MPPLSNIEAIKKILLLWVLLAIAHTANTQPVVEMPELTPDYGEVITLQNASYAEPGPSGENQAWDFSQLMTSGSNSVIFQDPNGLPGSGSFPEATHAVIQPNSAFSRAFLDYSDDQASFLGFYFDEEGVAQVYSDPRTLFEFPLTYNDSHTDTFASEGQQGTLTINEDGSIEAAVDGYGTLTTPAGEFEDVLRIKYEVDYTMTATEGGIVLEETNISTTEHQFVKGGYHDALLTLTEETENGQTSTRATYFTNSTSGIRKPHGPLYEVGIHPNPAADRINVEVSLSAPARAGFLLYSLSGSRVAHFGQRKLRTGKNSLQFSLPDINAGTYLLRIRDKDGEWISQSLVIIGRP